MSRKDLEQQIADYLSYMKDHVFSEITSPSSKVRSFYMRKPKGSDYRVMLTFSPEGITIQGDMTPEKNGATSSRGYDIEWFARQSGETDYLGQKFLQAKWVAEHAAEHLDWELEGSRASFDKKNDPDGVRKEHFDKLLDPETVDETVASDEKNDDLARLMWIVIAARDLRHHSMDEHEFYNFIQDHNIEYEGHQSYDPNELAILCAIQRKFAELYAKHLAEQADKYLILAAVKDGVNGQSLWWRPSHSGYTCSLGEAGIYTKAQAEQIQITSHGEHVAVPYAEAWAATVVEHAVPVGKAQELRKKATTPAT